MIKMCIKKFFNIKVSFVILVMYLFSSPATSDDVTVVINQPTSLDQILSACEISNIEELQTLLGADVFSYYELEEEYNTPLKKKVYNKSKDFKAKEKELADLKAAAKSKKYYYSFQMNEDAQYDTKKDGFIVPMNSTLMTTSVTDSDFNYSFTGLPVKIYNFGQYGKIANYNCIFLKMSEDDGLKIENGISSLQVYLIFNAEGITDIKIAEDFIQVSATQLEATSYSKRSALKCKVLQVVIADNETGEVYFSQIMKP